MNHFKGIQKFGFIVILLISFSACKKHGIKRNADLTLGFQTKLNDSNYQLSEPIRNAADDLDVKFELFQFYLSDITLINTDGEEQLISEIGLFKFDPSGKSSVDFEILNGDYTAIKFGLGVKKELNEADPSTYSEENHPLSITENTYWGWASMYRFISAEGRFDSDLDATYESTFAYHTGYEDTYRTIQIAHNFSVEKGSSSTIDFDIDIFQLLNKPGTVVNVPDESTYHGQIETFSIAERISANLESAISVTE